MSSRRVDWMPLEQSRVTDTSLTSVWLLALATYGVGDVVTTIALLYFSEGYTEANPIVRAVIQTFGGGGFLGLKLLVIYGCVGASLWVGLRNNDRVMLYGPPILLAVIGGYATAHNFVLLMA